MERMHRPTTGVDSYDQSLWAKTPPTTKNAFRIGNLGCVYQLSSGTEDKNNDVEIRACEANVLLFHRFGANIVDLRVTNKPYRARPEPWDGYFLPAGADAWFDSSNNAAKHVFHLHLENPFLESLAEVEGFGGAAKRLDARVLGLPPETRSLAQTLFHATERNQISELYWTSAASLLGLQLLLNGDDDLRAHARGGLAPWQVQRVCNFIEDHIAEEIALETLADLVGLSPHHFCRAFKASTGSPPHRWQLEARVRRAEAFMRERREGLAEIAILCGFFDQSHFTRVFQRFRGVSPGRWRRAIAT